MRQDPQCMGDPARMPGPARNANPLGVLGLDLVLTTGLLAGCFGIGLPTGTAILVAWLGGAVMTVALLVALSLDHQPRPAPDGQTALLP